MKGLVQLLGQQLLAIEQRIRKSDVTFSEYMAPDYQAALVKGIVSAHEATEIALFIKDAALDAEAFELVGIAEVIISSAASVAADEQNPAMNYGSESDDDPERSETRFYPLWKEHAERERRRAAEKRDLEERWRRLERVTTSNILARLDPPWLSSTKIFGLLKHMRLVAGGPGNYTLTDAGRALGEEVKKGAKGRRTIYWKKEVFDLVQTEITRIRDANRGRIHLPSSADAPDPDPLQPALDSSSDSPVEQ